MLGWLVGCSSLVPVPVVPTPPPPEPVIRFGGPCRAEHDYRRADGGIVPDGLTDMVRTYTWDARLLLVELREDRVGTGPSRAESYRYDDAGRLAWRRIESFGPNAYVQIETSERDAAGRLLRVTAQDDRTKKRWVTTHRYDERGRRTAYEYGAFGGRPSFRERYVYDGERIVRMEVDNAGAGTFPLTERQEHDALGRVVRRVHEWADRDDNPTQIDLFEYDSSGRLARSVDQRPYGGRDDPGIATEFDYDAAGNVRSERTLRVETGELRSQVTYDYSCWAGLSAVESPPLVLEPFEVSLAHKERVTELSF